MRGRSLVRVVVAAQVMLLAAALVGPASVAAATFGFTLGAPSVSTVQYSDLVTFRGTYTCMNDAASTCPTTSISRTATFWLRPSGGTTFTSVATVTTSVLFTTDPAGCLAACSVPFQVVWRAGRAGAITIPPGVYDVRLTSTIATGELVSLAALTITTEDTQTTYTGSSSGLGGDPLSVGASVTDLDRGLAPGTGIITPDANLGGAAMVTFALYDSTGTSLLAGPVSATLMPNGVTTGSPTLPTPTSGGSLRVLTTYLGNGYYLASSRATVVTIAPTNTPPSLVLPGVPVIAEATSADGAAVSYTVSATDVEDDPDPSPTCTPLSGSGFPLGDTTVACSVTDLGGATTTSSFTVRVIDTLAPSVSISTAEAPAESGWYNLASNDGVSGLTLDVVAADVVGVVSLTCTDNGVDVEPLTAPGDSFVLGDGTHAVACVATDAAGNSNGAAASFQVDQTAPSVSGALSPGGAGSGWWNAWTGAPTVTWTCADPTSGVASCSDPFTFGEGVNLGASGTAVDVAGNVGTSSVTGVHVDLTAPAAISLAGTTLGDGATYDFGSVPPAPTGCTAVDLGSGLASCSVSGGYSGAVGSWTVTATATDAAGNASSWSVGYAVLPWALAGFDKPVDMSGFNDLKAGGSAILRFSVNGGATDLSTVVVIVGIDQQPATCPAAKGGPGGHGGGTHETTSRKSGTPFTTRWQAPNQPGTCWFVTVRTADGSTLSAAFRLR